MHVLCFVASFFSSTYFIASDCIVVSDSDGDNLGHEDGSLWDGSDDGVDKVSDLDREWQRRHDQFHTVIFII